MWSKSDRLARKEQCWNAAAAISIAGTGNWPLEPRWRPQRSSCREQRWDKKLNMRKVFDCNGLKCAVSFSRASTAHGAALISVSCFTSRSREITDSGLVHRMVCPFTHQLSLVLINRPWRDGTLSWRWYTAAAGGSRTHDLAIASPAPYRTAVVYIYHNK